MLHIYTNKLNVRVVFGTNPCRIITCLVVFGIFLVVFVICLCSIYTMSV
jgi:hypothetical protein